MNHIICKPHLLQNCIESVTNRDATIYYQRYLLEIGDTYTIVAEQSGLSSQCVDCAEDASELIYSDVRANGTTLVEELIPPVEWVSGFTVATGYYNGHVAKAHVQAASLQEALESTKDYWDDPQFQSMKITRAILRSEEE
jgi:bacterioferritin-associated ferredoxin